MLIQKQESETYALKTNSTSFGGMKENSTNRARGSRRWYEHDSCSRWMCNLDAYFSAVSLRACFDRLAPERLVETPLEFCIMPCFSKINAAAKPLKNNGISPQVLWPGGDFTPTSPLRWLCPPSEYSKADAPFAGLSEVAAASWSTAALCRCLAGARQVTRAAGWLSRDRTGLSARTNPARTIQLCRPFRSFQCEGFPTRADPRNFPAQTPVAALH
jgi:hypothetical protein